VIGCDQLRIDSFATTAFQRVITDHRPLCDVGVSNAQRLDVPKVVEFMEGISQYVSVNVKLHKVLEN
jgi:hypothetical protein